MLSLRPSVESSIPTISSKNATHQKHIDPRIQHRFTLSQTIHYESHRTLISMTIWTLCSLFIHRQLDDLEKDPKTTDIVLRRRKRTMSHVRWHAVDAMRLDTIIASVLMRFETQCFFRFFPLFLIISWSFVAVFEEEDIGNMMYFMEHCLRH